MSTVRSVAEQASFLSQEIRRHREIYYSGADPEISDAEYDALEAALASLLADHPDVQAEIDSPLDEVGAATIRQPAEHSVPMLSLEKGHSGEDVEKFCSRFPGEAFLCMPKFDGVSAALTYRNGKLIRLATRGDGRTGEDVTANIGLVAGVLPQIADTRSVEIRGEIVMRRSDWQSYNQARPDKPLANPRNAAAGTLLAKDLQKVSDRRLTFFAFEMLVDDRPVEAPATALTGLGFDVELMLTLPGDRVWEYVEMTEQQRADRDYELDGVVIRVADPGVYVQSGARSNSPRGAIAIKLTAETATSVLRSVTWQVGKTGRITPVGEIDPVFLSGTTISRATLHNIDDIAEKDIRVGDRVLLKRAGDVIPYIFGPENPAARTGVERDVAPPADCPSCGQPVTAKTEARRIFVCENSAACPAQAVRRMIQWCSRDAADIDALGETWVELLHDGGAIKSVSDVYRLDKSTLTSFERMGDRAAERMLAGIENSKNVGLRRALIGLSIPLCSEGTAKRLCRAGYQTIEDVVAATSDQLQQVEDIGPMVADSIVRTFRQPAMVADIVSLRALGVNLDVLSQDGPQTAPATSGVAGKRMCVTGVLTVDRKVFQAELEAAGAKVTGSVSANLDYLVAGEKAGSKLSKAQSLGVTVLTEADARELLGS